MATGLLPAFPRAEAVAVDLRRVWLEKWFPGSRVIRGTRGEDGSTIELVEGGALPAATIRVKWKSDSSRAEADMVTAGSHALVQLASDKVDPAWRSRVVAEGFEVLMPEVAPGLVRVAWAPDPTGDDLPGRIAFLGSDPAVRFAEADPVGFGQTYPSDWMRSSSDPPYADHEILTRMIDAWSAGIDASSVVVGVMDTGIGRNLQRVGFNAWINPGEVPDNGVDDDRNGHVDDVHGADFVGGPYPSPLGLDEAHGPPVAGIIGAEAENGHQSVGVARTVRLMSLRVTTDFGTGVASSFVSGLDYGRARGARLFNASLGYTTASSAMAEAVERLRAADGLLVAAAGNDGADADTRVIYPATIPSQAVIAVGAADASGRASYSNFGDVMVDLFAPGSPIGESHRTGTSYAAPHVTGALALLKALRPAASAAELRTRLLASVQPVPALAGQSVTGGRLDIAEAIAPWLPPPSGDSRASARIAGPQGTVVLTTLGATREGGEAGSTREHTAWVRWTPRGAGPHEVVVVDRGFAGGNPEIRVFAAGGDVSLGTPVAGSTLPRVAFTVASGSAVDIQVADAPRDAGELVLVLRDASAPATGADAAEALEGERPRGVFATGNPGTSESRWWTWVPPGGGTASFTVNGRDSPGGSVLFHRVEGTGQVLLRSASIGAGQVRGSVLGVEFEAGVTYRLEIKGGGVLRWELDTRPSNDRRRSPTGIASSTERVGTVAGSTLAAGSDPLERFHDSWPARRSVWYSGDTPAYGRAMRIEVKGDPAAGLRLVPYVAGTFVSFPGATRLSDTVVEIQHVADQPTFSLVVDGDLPAAFVLDWEGGGPNDSFYLPLAIEGSSGATLAPLDTNRFAGTDDGEPSHDGSPAVASVWYRVSRESLDQGLQFVATSTDFVPRLGIYREDGSALRDDLVLERGTGPGMAWARVHVTTDMKLRVAVDTANGARGKFRLYRVPVEHGPQAPRVHDRRPLAQVLIRSEEASLAQARLGGQWVAWPSSSASRVLWWRTASDAPGRRTLRVRNSESGRVGVFRPNDTTPLVQVNLPAGVTTALEWDALPGQLFYVGVTGGRGLVKIEDVSEVPRPSPVAWAEQALVFSPGMVTTDTLTVLRRVDDGSVPLTVSVVDHAGGSAQTLTWPAGDRTPRQARLGTPSSNTMKALVAHAGPGFAPVVLPLGQGTTINSRRIPTVDGIRVDGRASSASGKVLVVSQDNPVFEKDLATGRLRLLPMQGFADASAIASIGGTVEGAKVLPFSPGNGSALVLYSLTEAGAWTSRVRLVPHLPDWGAGFVARGGHHLAVWVRNNVEVLGMSDPVRGFREVPGWVDETQLVHAVGDGRGGWYMVVTPEYQKNRIMHVDADTRLRDLGPDVVEPGVNWTYVAVGPDDTVWLGGMKSSSGSGVRLARLSHQLEVLGYWQMDGTTTFHDHLWFRDGGAEVVAAISGGEQEATPVSGHPVPAGIRVRGVGSTLGWTEDERPVVVDWQGDEMERWSMTDPGRAASLIVNVGTTGVDESVKEPFAEVEVPVELVPEEGLPLEFRWSWGSRSSVVNLMVPPGTSRMAVPLPPAGFDDDVVNGRISAMVEFAALGYPVRAGSERRFQVLDNDTPMGRWFVERGLAMSQLEEDSDRDGWSNFIEWVHGRDPRVADRAGDPPMALAIDPSTGDVEVRVVLPVAVSQGAPWFNSSANLRSWTNRIAVAIGEEVLPGGTHVVRRYRLSGLTGSDRVAVQMVLVRDLAW